MLHKKNWMSKCLRFRLQKLEHAMQRYIGLIQIMNNVLKKAKPE